MGNLQFYKKIKFIKKTRDNNQYDYSKETKKKINFAV